jgi:ketosteroid isomerase-like protein
MRDDRGKPSGLSEAGPNAELVARAFERWNARDHESVLQDVDPNVEIRVASTEAFEGEPFRGHDGYRRWVASMEESFESWVVEPELFREKGDTVVVLGRMFLRGRASGVTLTQETGWVIELRNGKALRFQAFLDHAEALAAAGLD